MLQLGLYDTIAGPLILDASPRASQVVLLTGEHGFHTLSCFVRMSLWEAFLLYDRPGLPHVQLTEYGLPVWQGRLEDVAIVAGGVKLTALGYWRALSDVPYANLWSKSDFRDFVALTVDNNSAIASERYQLDNNNRLWIAPAKNSTFGTTGTQKTGVWGYEIPRGSVRQIVSVKFDYAFFAPANWNASCEHWGGTTPIWTFTGNDWSLNGNGALQTGTQTLAITATNKIVFRIYFNAADAAYAGETGAAYLKITNLTILTTTSAHLYADEIAKDLVVTVNASNPNQLAAGAALIGAPGVILTDQQYQDKYPSAILDNLAKIGDSATPPNLYETGVWEGQLLTFQKRGLTARTWYVDLADLQLERTIDQLYNSVYAVYQDYFTNQPLRTAANSDAASIARYGLTRQRAVTAQTTSTTQAQVQRDAGLQDGKDPQPRIAVAVSRVYDGAGSPWPLWAPRAWDTLVIRNLPATLSTALDRIRQFRIIETRYDLDHGLLTVTPETFIPSLDVLVARRAAGILT